MVGGPPNEWEVYNEEFDRPANHSRNRYYQPTAAFSDDQHPPATGRQQEITGTRTKEAKTQAASDRWYRSGWSPSTKLSSYTAPPPTHANSSPTPHVVGGRSGLVLYTRVMLPADWTILIDKQTDRQTAHRLDALPSIRQPTSPISNCHLAIDSCDVIRLSFHDHERYRNKTTPSHRIHRKTVTNVMHCHFCLYSEWK